MKLKASAQSHHQMLARLEILEEREVEVAGAGSASDTPGGRAEAGDGGSVGGGDGAGDGEGAGIELAVDSLIGQVQRLTWHSVRHVDGGEKLIAGRDARSADIGDEAAAHGENAIDLPAAEQEAADGLAASLGLPGPNGSS